MSSAAPASPKKTPLHARHRAAGARMVEYAGWDMPVEYAGIAQEHLAVRTHAGVFDVSHMGEIEIAGPDALDLVQWLTSNDASRLAIGQIQYSALTTDTGTFVDDLLVYRLADAHFLLVVNAANIVKDYEWMVAQTKQRAGDRAVVNCSSRYALIALQGPAAQPILQTLTAIFRSDHRFHVVASHRERQRRFVATRARLRHHGIVAFSQRVNVPVGPSGPSSATRTTSREPSSTDSVPAYPLRFVLVKAGETKLTLIPVDSSSIIMASVIALRAVLDAG